MQAIETKYISPSNTKGARIKATCVAGSITISYPHELSGMAVHEAAAVALCQKLAKDGGKHWLKPLVGGQLVNGNYVFVFKD